MNLNYTIAYKAWNNINDSKLTALKRSLFKAAHRYATIRAEWQFMSLEEQVEADAERSRAHNNFIDTCNILSRAQVSENENNTWRLEIGMERKMIGDFACYVNCFIGIENR